jgi:glutaredoxin
MSEQAQPMAKVKVYFTSWCPDCRKALRFLDQQGIAYEGIDVDESEEGEELVLRVNDGRRRVPTFEIGGRYFACSPYDREALARELKDLRKS